ncbi:hypothetical protein Bbelb_160620 [Branchiostoma belcheri]|nr:hypothetical protein Bbelb_160620 [Branchiostoma belcheri]
MSAEALQLDTWTGQNDMILNGKKSQQLQICFGRNTPVPPPLSLGGELVSVTTTAKGLGDELSTSMERVQKTRCAHHLPRRKATSSKAPFFERKEGSGRFEAVHSYDKA